MEQHELSPFDLEYENIGAGCASVACTLPPVPIGPAAALTLPPMVTFPPIEKARMASSELSTITKSVISAPICKPQPTPPVAIQEGADHEPSGSRATTRPEPALPEKTKPALMTWKTARPGITNITLEETRKVGEHTSSAR
jgi:hypothetical protein